MNEEANQTKPGGPVVPTTEIPLALQLEARSLEAELAGAERDVMALYARQRELGERLETAMDKMKALASNGGRVVFDEGTLRYAILPSPVPPVVSLPPQLERRRKWMRG
jgi:hypothetical protein